MPDVRNQIIKKNQGGKYRKNQNVENLVKNQNSA